MSHIIHESLHAKVFSLAFDKLPAELEGEFPSTAAAMLVYHQIRNEEFDGVNNLHLIMAQFYTDEYANAMWEMSGQVGEPKDYLYWAYDGLGIDPEVLLGTKDWNFIQNDWTEIENNVNINCE